MPAFFLRCHFKSPQCLEPNGFLFVWLPHHIGAMLCWDRVHSGVFFLPPPVCCLRVRGTINKHCAFMERSCVAQQGISRAAWLCAWIKCLPSTVLMFMSYCLNSNDLYGIWVCLQCRTYKLLGYIGYMEGITKSLYEFSVETFSSVKPDMTHLHLVWLDDPRSAFCRGSLHLWRWFQRNFTASLMPLQMWEPVA